MLNRLCDRVTVVARLLMWIGFAALIATVALQVIARNLLTTPMIWTSDLAQLLFTWLIFVGAAVGLRTGAHYDVDLLPMNRPAVARSVEIISLVAGACVSWLLIRHGWELAIVRATAEVQSLGISRFWMFLPLPVSGALMALYLLEMAAGMARRAT